MGPNGKVGAGGIVNFILSGGMKKLLMDEMSGDYGNHDFCGGSSIMDAELSKRFETKEEGNGKTMGDAFTDIGTSLSDSITMSGNGDGKNVSFSMDSVAGSGGGEVFTPNDQVKITKENLMAKMEQLQADFKKLEEEDLKDSPAQAVKKRKRRQSSEKSGK